MRALLLLLLVACGGTVAPDEECQPSTEECVDQGPAALCNNHRTCSTGGVWVYGCCANGCDDAGACR